MTTSTVSMRIRFVIAIIAALVLGVLLSVQARINGELGVALDDSLAAAIVSFGVGLIALTAMMVVTQRGRGGFIAIMRAFGSRRIPFWYAAGGLAGALFVLSQTTTVALLGVAMFTIATVAGQVLGGMVIDRVGVGSMSPKPITSWRLAGALLALVAVVIAMIARVQVDIPFWMLLLPFVAGVLQGWQQAVNGQLREQGGAVPAAVVSFTVGLIALLLAGGLRWSMVGMPQSLPQEWWLYVGGILGAAYVAGAASLVRLLGVLLLGLSVVAGQLSSSLALDLLLPTAGTVVQPTTVVGTLITLGAIAVAAVRPWRRRTAPAVSRPRA